MMDEILPEYWLHRPSIDLDDAARAAFDELLAWARTNGPNAELHYALARPKWQFLCYAAEAHGLALHGTGDPNIQEFEPRQSNDLNPFGDRKAVYAAGDGLWAMYFAIIDRDRYDMSLNNACIRLADPSGQVSPPRYVFSISQTALAQRPWRTGSVYLLPAEPFVTQPPMPFGPYEVRIPQLASLTAVRPLARLAVAPEDFPMLDAIRGHDDARMHEYAQALMTAGPWPE
jgi:hypothetical protein